MEVQKLSLTSTLRKGLQLTGSRETTRTQAAPADSTTVAPAQHGSDARCTLTQALGKAGKLSFSYAQLTADDAMRSREYASRLETPVGRLRLTADFANRQAAGAPTVVIQGFTLTDQVKERRLTWSCHYRHRSAAAGTETETKGWNIGYNGAGARPLKLTASYLRNAEAKDGKVTPGKQARMEMTTGISRRLTLGASYINNVDENARKADERFQVTLSGPSARMRSSRFWAPPSASLNPRVLPRSSAPAWRPCAWSIATASTSRRRSASARTCAGVSIAARRPAATANTAQISAGSEASKRAGAPPPIPRMTGAGTDGEGARARRLIPARYTTGGCSPACGAPRASTVYIKVDSIQVEGAGRGHPAHAPVHAERAASAWRYQVLLPPAWI